MYAIQIHKMYWIQYVSDTSFATKITIQIHKIMMSYIRLNDVVIITLKSEP
jgi:hypothetical protein